MKSYAKQAFLRRALALSSLYWVAALAAGGTSLLGPSDVSAQVCARVKIEIVQELTLERQAFDAKMRITNGLKTLPIEDIAIVVNFQDAQGNAVVGTSDPNDLSASFFLTMDSVTGVSGDVAAGTGRISADTAGELHWLIIPAPGAAGPSTEGTLYFVGASVTYSLGGEERTVDVVPDSIYVRPMPRLYLDYFLVDQVHGDNPYTPAVEPPEPFPLGVRVANQGYGPAANLKIESSQPEIIENELGLLISFEMIGSYVQDQPINTGLLADFGTINAGSSKNARWILTSTLQGQFVEFTASFSHSDALGGKLTSLMEEVNTHKLVRDVLVQAPGRDGVRDFLANDNGTYRVFESDSVSHTDVFAVASPSVSPAGPGTYTLTTGAVGGMLYAKFTDPTGGQQELTEVTRSDGKVLHPANAWQSKVWVKQSQSYLFYVNVFDESNTQPWTYELRFGGAKSTNYAPVLGSLADRSIPVGEALLYTVTATDANAGDALALAAAPLPQGAVFTDLGNGSATLAWTPTEAEIASYPVQFTVYDGALFDSHVATFTVVPAGTANSAPTSAHAELVAEKNHASAPVTPTVVDADAGDTHFYAVASQPAHGEASVVANQLVYVPEPNYVGTDAFTFEAADPFGASVVGTANVIVTDGDDLVAIEIQLAGDEHDPTSATVSVDNDGTIASIVPVTVKLYAQSCAAKTEIGSVTQVFGPGTTGVVFPIDLASFAGEPLVLVAEADTSDALPELDEMNNRVTLGVRVGSAPASSLFVASSQAAPVDLCADQTFGAVGRSHYVLHESAGTCIGPMVAGAVVAFELEDLGSESVVRQGTAWADGDGAWHLEFSLPAATGVSYELRMSASDGASGALLTRAFSTQTCAPAIPAPMVAAPPFPGPYGDAATVRFSDPATQLPWLVYPGTAIPAAGPDGSGSLGHTHGTGSSANVPESSPAVGSKGGAIAPEAFDAAVDAASLSTSPAELLVNHATTLHGVIGVNDSYYGLPAEWTVVEPSGASWQIAPTTWFYANGPLHVVANFTPREEGTHTFGLRVGDGVNDASAANDSASDTSDAGPDPDATTPVLSLVAPSSSLRDTQLLVALTGAKLTEDATLDCGGQGLTVSDLVVALDAGDNTFGSSAVALVTLAPDATVGWRDCTLTTSFGSSTLLSAFRVLETLCDDVVCGDEPPTVCYAYGSGACDLQTGQCAYQPMPQGSACDDGFACTTGATCDGAGGCGVAQASACNDGVPCTIEVCDSQSGCLNEPTTPDCNTAGCLTMGDVNGSNTMNVSDVMCIVLVSLWMSTPNNPDPQPSCLKGPIELADVNCNGQVNVSDVQLSVYLALGVQLGSTLDANDDHCPDACQP